MKPRNYVEWRRLWHNRLRIAGDYATRVYMLRARLLPPEFTGEYDYSVRRLWQLAYQCHRIYQQLKASEMDQSWCDDLIQHVFRRKDEQ